MSPNEDAHDTLRLLLAGSRSVAEGPFRELLLHLTKDCPACNALLQPFDPGDIFPLFADRRSPPAPLEDLLEHDPFVERTVRTTLSRQQAFEREEIGARDLLLELLAFPESERRDQIEQDARFRFRSICEALLEEAVRRRFEDPGGAVELAELAIFMAAHLDRDFYGRGAVADVTARAWATLANALRVISDLRGAERAFQRSALLLAIGSGDPLARAKILSLKASLRIEQRRFEAADRLLEEAITTYLRTGEEHLAGRTLLKRAALSDYRGEPTLSIPFLEEAERRIDSRQEPMLEIAVRHNLLVALSSTGRAAEARELMAQSEELYRSFEAPWLRAQKIWVEGKIALGLEEFEEAEQKLEQARTLYSQRETLTSWSLSSLDLAMVYLATGRGAELRSIAQAVFGAFQSLDLHREAFAALLLFHRAAEMEQLTAVVIQNLITAFKRYPYSPPTQPS